MKNITLTIVLSIMMALPGIANSEQEEVEGEPITVEQVRSQCNGLAKFIFQVATKRDNEMEMDLVQYVALEGFKKQPGITDRQKLDTLDMIGVVYDIKTVHPMPFSIYMFNYCRGATSESIDTVKIKLESCQEAGGTENDISACAVIASTENPLR